MSETEVRLTATGTHVFDISFFELLLCGIVALVVVGPERLPETVRAVSLWIGRLKRSLRETRSELEKQLGADDIRRQLHNEEIMQSIEKTRREIERSLYQAEHETRGLIEHQPPGQTEHQELPDHAHMDEALPNTPTAEATEPKGAGDHSQAPSPTSVSVTDKSSS